MAEYPTTQNALLQETKVSQKWNSNEKRRKIYNLQAQLKEA